MIHLPDSSDNDPELPLVPVYPAIVWVCPNCETENFARMVVEEREQYGLNCDTERGYLTPPDEVECGHCGQQFETDSSFGGVDHIGDVDDVDDD